MNQNPERPFGVLVDTRLPVSHTRLRKLVSEWRFPAEVPRVKVLFTYDDPPDNFRYAFRNAEAAEASE